MTQFEREQLAWLQLQVLLAGRSNLPPAHVLQLFNKCLAEQEANRSAGYPVTPAPAREAQPRLFEGDSDNTSPTSWMG